MTSSQPVLDVEQEELLSRREYLMSLRKWSKVVIGVIALGGVLTQTEQESEAASWVNRRGSGGWRNGGRAWANRSPGGGSWANRR
ncbi:MAG: hypothetical protein GY801_51175 [bacterium]|nr:hypothetical protein [bacterium]